MSNFFRKYFLCIGVIVALYLLVISSAWAQQASGVSVMVSTASLSGKMTYQYKVVNNSNKQIVSVSVGEDHLHGAPELLVPPDGWTKDTGLAQGSMMATSGWTSRVITQEEVAELELEWINDGSENMDIFPGETRSGFSVVIPGQNNLYLTSHWTVRFGDGSNASGSLITQI